MPGGEVKAEGPGDPARVRGQPRAGEPVLHWAFDAWMDREFPDCPFERYADDGLIHCKSQARARQVLAALERRMRDVGLELHPGKTQIVYCKDYRRRKPWDGPVSFDFLGYAFRPRDTIGKYSRFTGFDLAVSPTAVKRMNAVVAGWRLHRHTDLTWEQLAGWLGPVIHGWMTYYGRFRHSVLDPLLARINYHVQKWIRRKYRRLRAYKAMKRAWDRITDQMPGLLPHWRWETGAWY
jgi:RNA-directed DNA polymerase